MTRRTVLIGIIVVVVAILVALGYHSATKQQPAAKAPTVDTNVAASQPIVRFDGTAFTPATYTMKSGSKIVFLNTSPTPLQLYSTPNPTHTDNPELNLGEIAPGTSKTVVLTKVGTWSYFNGLNPSETGKLTVQ